MKLSHSAKEMFNTCKYKWHLHYQKRYRSVRQSSALAVGNSLDLALNELLLTRDLLKATDVFWNSWEEWKEKPLLDFFKSDFDEELLTSQDKEEIQNNPDNEHLANWLSLRQKGLRMLAAYDLEIMPNIAEVISVQEEFTIPIANTEHFVGGKLDLTAKLYENKIVGPARILDNKSTSTPYPKNSCEKKEQTAIYSTGLPEYDSNVGFLTINKKNFKTQILLGKSPVELQLAVMQQFVEMVNYIDNNTDFEQNTKGCWSFGSRCQFYTHCHNGEFSEDIYEAEREEDV